MYQHNLVNAVTIMKKSKIFLVITLFLNLTFSVHSAELSEKDILNKLQSEIDNQTYDSAWSTATLHADKYLGEPKFDFLYGVAALANNQAEHAVFAFERVTSNQPSWLYAHYLLAKANYQISNYQTAIDGGQLLLSHESTPSELKQPVQELMHLAQAKLDKQSLYIANSISLNLGHDSNINAGTNEDSIYLPFLRAEIPLSETSQENSDTYGALTYQLTGEKTLSQKSKVLFSGQATLQQFSQATEYNRMFARISAKYQHAFSFGKVALGVKVTPLWLDDDFYRTQSAITIDFNKPINHQWTLTSGISIGEINNKINNTLNNDTLSAHVFTHYYSGNTKHSIGIDYVNETSKLVDYNHNSRQLTTIKYTTLWLINNHWSATSQIGFQKSSYDENHPFFLTKRQDDLWLASAMLQYKHSSKWSYRLSLNVLDKDSNISLFSYQRSDISLSAMFNF